MATTRLRKVRGPLTTGIGIASIIGILAIGLMPGRAQASFVEFNFTCQIGAVDCTGSGSFGTLRITDAAQAGLTDPLRVAIEWHLDPAFGQTIERVLLNFKEPFLTNHNFLLMGTDPPAGAQGPVVGTVAYSNNAQKLGGYGFDLNLVTFAQDVCPGNDTCDFAGTLALFNALPSPDVQVPLLPTDFSVTTVATPADPGQPPLLAAYRTNNNPTPPPSGEFHAGAPVPEPASLLLLGTGLLALGGLGARRRAAKKRALTDRAAR